MRSACIALALSVLAGGCHGHDHDDHDHDHDGGEGEQFICDGDEDPFDPGTTAEGANGAFDLVIVSSDPIPHTVDINELRVRLVDADDQTPVAGASFDLIEPLTAKHDHGTPIVPEWSEATDAVGEYEVTNINYVHRGPWFLDFEVSAGSDTDSMRFKFCIVDPGFEDGGMGQ